MRSIDTNVLIRLVTRDDSRQAAAAGSFIEQGAWVSLLALAEAIWVLQSVYQRSARELASALEVLLNHKTLMLEDPGVVASALALFKAKPSLGFSDCLILELSRKSGHLPLGTFDRALSRIDGVKRL